jgi:hypothetical protein
MSVRPSFVFRRQARWRLGDLCMSRSQVRNAVDRLMILLERSVFGFQLISSQHLASVTPSYGRSIACEESVYHNAPVMCTMR